MSQITCPGQVVTTVAGEAQCLDMSNQPLAWTVMPAFSVQALDPVMLSGAFGAGFFVMAMGWVVSRGVRVVIDMLK